MQNLLHNLNTEQLATVTSSRVKQYPATTPHDIIAQARTMIDVPVVVIGGMTVDNARPLVAQGARMVAAISSVYGATDARHAATALRDLFA